MSNLLKGTTMDLETTRSLVGKNIITKVILEKWRQKR